MVVEQAQKLWWKCPEKQLGLNRHIAVDVIQVNGNVICRLTGFEGLNGTVVVFVIGVEGGELMFRLFRGQ